MAVAEEALGLGGGEEHLLAGHADAVDGDHRVLAAGEAGDGFGDVGDGHDQVVGQADRRRGAASEAGDFGEDVLEAEIVTAEDIAFAGGALVESQQVAGGDIVHMDDVEAGIHIGGHAAGGGIVDHAAGGGGLDVAGADRGRRVDDHRRQPFLRHQPADFGFG